MSELNKTLGQSAPAATTLTDIYTVPASKNVVVSSVIVCNRGNTTTTFRISVAPSGAADSNEQYYYYDVPISKNNTFVATIGVGMLETDVLRVYAGNADLSFNATGVEVDV